MKTNVYRAAQKNGIYMNVKNACMSEVSLFIFRFSAWTVFTNLGLGPDLLDSVVCLL